MRRARPHPDRFRRRSDPIARVRRGFSWSVWTTRAYPAAPIFSAMPRLLGSGSRPERTAPIRTPGHRGERQSSPRRAATDPNFNSPSQSLAPSVRSPACHIGKASRGSRHPARCIGHGFEHGGLTRSYDSTKLCLNIKVCAYLPYLRTLTLAHQESPKTNCFGEKNLGVATVCARVTLAFYWHSAPRRRCRAPARIIRSKLNTPRDL